MRCLCSAAKSRRAWADPGQSFLRQQRPRCRSTRSLGHAGRRAATGQWRSSLPSSDERHRSLCTTYLTRAVFRRPFSHVLFRLIDYPDRTGAFGRRIVWQVEPVGQIERGESRQTAAVRREMDMPGRRAILEKRHGKRRGMGGKVLELHIEHGLQAAQALRIYPYGIQVLVDVAASLQPWCRGHVPAIAFQDWKPSASSFRPLY